MSTKSSSLNYTGPSQLRKYQRRIVNEARGHNVIVRLPTGAGKTLIAAEIIRNLVCEGKRALVLVPSRILVKQQAKAVKSWLDRGDTDTNVGKYHGELTLPSNFDVLVTTPKAFETAQAKQRVAKIQSTSKGSLAWESFSLVVFDEVHHMLKDHPYRKLTKSLSKLRSRNIQSELPHVVGLTASLTYEVTEPKIKKSIDKLCSEFGVTQILQATVPELVQDGYKGTQAAADVFVEDEPSDSGILPIKERRPHLMCETFEERVAQGKATKFALELMACVESLEKYALEIDASFVSPRTTHKLKKWESEMHKLAKSTTAKVPPHNYVPSVLEELSWWYGAVRMLVVTWEEADYAAAHLLQMYNIPELYTTKITEGLFPRHTSDIHAQVMSFLTTITPFSRYEQVKRKLCEEFDQQLSLGACFRGIIFVEQRISTHILEHVIRTDERTRTKFHPRVVYSAGAPASPTLKLTKSHQEEALEAFRTGEANLLVATSVAEEGLDVEAANCVIRFDKMVNSVSLTQSRGRARQAGSSFIVMSEREDRTTRDLEQAERVQMKVCADYKVVPKTAQETATALQQECKKQASREAGVLQKVRTKITVDGVNENNALSLLHQICKSTKVDLSCHESSSGVILTYDSVLRKRQTHAEFTCRERAGKKKRKVKGPKRKRCAKQRAAVEMVNLLQQDFGN